MGPRARLFMPSNAHRDFQVFDFECVLRHLVASNLRCEVSNPSLSAINKKGQTHSLTPFFSAPAPPSIPMGIRSRCSSPNGGAAIFLD